MPTPNWTPELHPRDRHGRFIEKFGWVTWLLDGHRHRGQVTKIEGVRGRTMLRVREGESTHYLTPGDVDSAPSPKADLDVSGEKSAWTDGMPISSYSDLLTKDDWKEVLDRQHARTDDPKRVAAAEGRIRMLMVGGDWVDRAGRVSLHGLYAEDAEAVADTLTKLHDDYPEVFARRFAGIVPDHDLSPGGSPEGMGATPMAMTTSFRSSLGGDIYRVGSVLSLDKKLYQMMYDEPLSASDPLAGGPLRRDIVSRNAVLNGTLVSDSIEGTIAHEFGHVLSLDARLSNDPDAWKTPATNMNVDRALPTYPGSPKKLREFDHKDMGVISFYGNPDRNGGLPDEEFAESFAAYYLGYLGDPEKPWLNTHFAEMTTSETSRRRAWVEAVLDVTNRPSTGDDIAPRHYLPENVGAKADLNPEEYRGQHQPGNDGPPAWNLAAEGGEWGMPADVYDHPDWYVGDPGSQASKETIAVLRKIRGNPDAEVTIYRGAPPDATEINPGDWVTLSPTYAKEHGYDPVDPSKDWPVLSRKVPASEVIFAGDDLNEFGWWPPEQKAGISIFNPKPQFSVADGVVTATLDGNEVGALRYRDEGQALVVESVYTDPSIRGRDISYRLTSELLKAEGDKPLFLPNNYYGVKSGISIDTTPEVVDAGIAPGTQLDREQEGKLLDALKEGADIPDWGGGSLAPDGRRTRTKVILNGKRSVLGEEGDYVLYDEGRDGKAFAAAIPGTERPLDYVWRAITPEDWARVQAQGFLDSDARDAISAEEGMNAALDPESAFSYLPYPRNGGRGVVVRIKVQPEDGWFGLKVDDYPRTRQQIPLDRIDMVTPVIERKGKYNLLYMADPNAEEIGTKADLNLDWNPPQPPPGYEEDVDPIAQQWGRHLFIDPVAALQDDQLYVALKAQIANPTIEGADIRSMQDKVDSMEAKAIRQREINIDTLNAQYKNWEAEKIVRVSIPREDGQNDEDRLFALSDFTDGEMKALIAGRAAPPTLYGVDEASPLASTEWYSTDGDLTDGSYADGISRASEALLGLPQSDTSRKSWVGYGPGGNGFGGNQATEAAELMHGIASSQSLAPLSVEPEEDWGGYGTMQGPVFRGMSLPPDSPLLREGSTVRMGNSFWLANEGPGTPDTVRELWGVTLGPDDPEVPVVVVAEDKIRGYQILDSDEFVSQGQFDVVKVEPPEIAPAFLHDKVMRFNTEVLIDAIRNDPTDLGTVWRVQQGEGDPGPGLWAVATSEDEARRYLDAQETGGITGQHIVRIDNAKGLLYPDGREGIILIEGWGVPSDYGRSVGVPVRSDMIRQLGLAKRHDLNDPPDLTGEEITAYRAALAEGRDTTYDPRVTVVQEKLKALPMEDQLVWLSIMRGDALDSAMKQWRSDFINSSNMRVMSRGGRDYTKITVRQTGVLEPAALTDYRFVVDPADADAAPQVDMVGATSGISSEPEVRKIDPRIKAEPEYAAPPTYTEDERLVVSGWTTDSAWFSMADNDGRMEDGIPDDVQRAYASVQDEFTALTHRLTVNGKPSRWLVSLAADDRVEGDNLGICYFAGGRKGEIEIAMLEGTDGSYDPVDPRDRQELAHTFVHEAAHAYLNEVSPWEEGGTRIEDFEAMHTSLWNDKPRIISPWRYGYTSGTQEFACDIIAYSVTDPTVVAHGVEQYDWDPAEIDRLVGVAVGQPDFRKVRDAVAAQSDVGAKAAIDLLPDIEVDQREGESIKAAVRRATIDTSSPVSLAPAETRAIVIEEKNARFADDYARSKAAFSPALNKGNPPLLPMAETKKVIADRFKEHAKGPVVIRIPREFAPSVAEHQAIGNQFVTGTSVGAYVPEERGNFEEATWGDGERGRIIYGYVFDEAKSSQADWYGDLIFVLRPEVKSRATVTVGDSLASQVAPIPMTEIDKATPDEVIAAFSAGTANSSMIYDAANTTGFSPSGYIEAQIQGVPTPPITPVDWKGHLTNPHKLGAVVPLDWVDHIEFDPFRSRLSSQDDGQGYKADWEWDLQEAQKNFPGIPVVWHEDAKIKPYMADEVGSQAAIDLTPIPSADLPEVLHPVGHLGAVPVAQPGRGMVTDPLVPKTPKTGQKDTGLYTRTPSPEHGFLDYQSQTDEGKAKRLLAITGGGTGNRGGKKNVELRGVPGFEDVTDDESVIDQMVHNLRTVVDSIPEGEHPENWAQWYPLAHDYIGTQAEAKGIDADVGYAVTARLSPQTDWTHNVAMSNTIFMLWGDNPTIDQTTLDAAVVNAKAIVAKGKAGSSAEKRIKSFDVGDGMTLQEIAAADPEVASYLIRLYADTHDISPLTYDWDTHTWVIVRNADGGRSRTRWQSFDNIAPAMEMLANPTYETINMRLGEDEKIRSFYNDMRDNGDPPVDEWGHDYRDVTTDTHHAGAAFGIPMSSSAFEISTSGETNNFTGVSILAQPVESKTGGRGAYPLIVEATRRLADDPAMKERFGDITPAQLQSVIWEAWKRMWPDGSIEGYPGIRNEWLTDIVRAIRSNPNMTVGEKDALVEHIRSKAVAISHSDGALNISAILSGEPAWLAEAWSAEQAHHGAAPPSRRSVATPQPYKRKARITA